MNNDLLAVHAKSFHWASFFLSKETYNKCSSLYNFCRTLDDIADDNNDLEVKKKNFLEFKNNFSNKNFENPIIKNMWNLLENERISKIVIDDLFNGVEGDLENEVKINSQKDLLVYSYRVAGTGGDLTKIEAQVLEGQIALENMKEISNKLSQQPLNADLRYQLAMLTWKWKSHDEGLRWLRVVLLTDPTHEKARQFLKKDGLDYAHGTGHGVGFFSNVHEGPQSISKYNSIKLKEGMILSNEPGYYKKNKYGIRIENLIYIKKNKKKLKFENLTLAPIEKDLINYKLLNKNEKDYLFQYHLDVYAKLSKFLSSNEKKWLARFI